MTVTKMKLINHADGIDGHYCIGRPSAQYGSPYWEFYNKGEWCSAGEILTKEAAEELLNKLLSQTT